MQRVQIGGYRSKRAFKNKQFWGYVVLRIETYLKAKSEKPGVS